MKHKPALFALVRLHGELAGKIKDNAREAQSLRGKMKHVEAVIRLLEPGFDTRKIAVRRRNNQNPYFKRGTVFRAALSVLRTAPAPMTTDEIGVALLRTTGIAEPTRDDVRFMYGAVNTSLIKNEGKTVASDGGRPRRWSLTPHPSASTASST